MQKKEFERALQIEMFLVTCKVRFRVRRSVLACQRYLYFITLR